MNKRIKKKQEKRKSKIPKHIIRLANRWTDMDTTFLSGMGSILDIIMNVKSEDIK